jgi:hypothetical protein
MFDRIRDLVRRLSMTNVPSLERLDANLADARQKLAVAQTAHGAARQRYVDSLVGDEGVAASAKVKKQVADAADALRQARDRCEALEAMREKAAEADAAATMAARVREAQTHGRALVWEASMIEQEIRGLVARCERCAELGEAFRRSLPVAVPTFEEGSMFHLRGSLLRRVRLSLFAHSNGLLEAGTARTSPFVLSQGPTLEMFARDSVKRALAFQPKVEPPPSAEGELA